MEVVAAAAVKWKLAPPPSAVPSAPATREAAPAERPGAMCDTVAATGAAVAAGGGRPAVVARPERRCGERSSRASVAAPVSAPAGAEPLASGNVLHPTTHSNCIPLPVAMHSRTLMAPSTVNWGHRALLMIKPLDAGRGTPPRWGGRT